MNASPEKLGELIRAAGRRPGPDAATLERLRAAAHASWQARLAERRQRQRRVFAMAASVLAVVAGALLTFTLRDTGSAVMVARVVEAGPASGPLRQIGVGEEVQAGPAGMALERMPGTATRLRLASGTRIRWQSAEEIELLSGQLYVDTGRTGDAQALRIGAGPVQIEHVGTQFVTQRFADRVQVRVRDGVVRMTRDNETLQLGAGEGGIASFRTGEALARSPAARSGPEWEWVEALAPSVIVEGRSLRAVLEDLAYESGLPLRFDSPASEAAAAATQLHGPAVVLPPPAALRAVLATTQLQVLDAAGSDEQIVIGTR